MIRGMIEGGIDFKNEIFLPGIKGSTVILVIEFLRHVAANNPVPEIEKLLRSSELKDVTTEWYADYIDKDKETLFEIILAANFLEIKDLLGLACAKVASKIIN